MILVKEGFKIAFSELRASNNKYISHNKTVSTSWLDDILRSRFSIASKVDIVYGKTFSDYIPIACHICLPYKVVVSALDDNFNILNGYSFLLENFSDDCLKCKP